MSHAKKVRCPWLNLDNKIYVDYHDTEWGRPVHDDNKLFEMLVLEEAQAGLSWETVLKKRDHYREAFENFEPKKVARFSLGKQQKLLSNPNIIRNKLKISSAVQNSKAFLEVQNEFGSFNKYIWQFVNNKPIKNKFKSLAYYPSETLLSKIISKDLKKRGFNFVGPTIRMSFV